MLKSLFLTNFRNHKKREITFDTTTIIIGKNTAGKTNILEAINYFSAARSFKAEVETDVIMLSENFSRIEAVITNDAKTKLSILFNNAKRVTPKKYLVNDVARRAHDFASHFTAVLFTPEDIDIITGSPGSRRHYVDSILYKAHREYRVAHGIYEKALKHRNRMLKDMKDGKKHYGEREFSYWNNLLIEHAATITKFREQFVEYVNRSEKEIFAFSMEYDASLMNEARLEKYHDAERAAGITLVGPQRDDFFLYYAGTQNAIYEYGSRGEQRLTLLQLKLFEIEYLRLHTESTPTLLLDDIFSELDNTNIKRVFKLAPHQQTIITTTHREFIPDSITADPNLTVIELTKD